MSTLLACKAEKVINFMLRKCILHRGHRGKHTDGDGRRWLY